MKERYLILDLLRGLAICGMIFYHLFFIMDFYGVGDYAMRQGAWHILARTVQISFMSTVGMMIGMSWNKKKKRYNEFLFRRLNRGLQVLIGAGIVTLVTYLFINENFVQFGILHLIGSSVILSSLIAPFPVLTLLTGILIFALTPWMQTITSTGYFGYLIGFNVPDLSAIDYFPLFPWLGVVLIGLTIGHILSKYASRLLAVNKYCNNIAARTLIKFGQNSFPIYLVHIPILILLLIIFGVLQLDLFL